MVNNDVFLEREFVRSFEIYDTEELLRTEFGLPTYNENREHIPLQFIDTTENERYDGGYVISIDQVVNMVDVFKKSGVTHVSITRHTDSETYDFQGYRINTVDQDTINRTLSKEKMEFLLKRQENLLKNLDIIHKDIIKLSENGNG